MTDFIFDLLCPFQNGGQWGAGEFFCCPVPCFPVNGKIGVGPRHCRSSFRAVGPVARHATMNAKTINATAGDPPPMCAARTVAVAVVIVFLLSILQTQNIPECRGGARYLW
jgi:hypothetical protein